MKEIKLHRIITSENWCEKLARSETIMINQKNIRKH